MATYEWISGAETGALPAREVAGESSGQWDSGAGTGSGTASADATIYHTGAYSYKYAVASNVAISHTRTFAAAQSVVVGCFYFYVSALPNATVGDRNIVRIVAGNSVFFSINSSGQLKATIGGTAQTASVTVSTGQWYRVDFRGNKSANPHTLDWKVDGTDQTQATLANPAQTFTAYVQGWLQTPNASGDTTSRDIYFDDIAYSFTSGDYPLLLDEIVKLSPTGDGTHNAGTNTMEDNAGNDINGTTVTAYTLLDEIPITTTDYVRQATVGTGNYAEVTFADTATTKVIECVKGAAVVGAGTTSGANTGGMVIIRNDSTEIAVAGSSTVPIDYALNSQPNGAEAVVTAPGGGWTTAEVNALKCRMGYSSDIDPAPRWYGIILEMGLSPAVVTGRVQGLAAQIVG